MRKGKEATCGSRTTDALDALLLGSMASLLRLPDDIDAKRQFEQRYDCGTGTRKTGRSAERTFHERSWTLGLCPSGSVSQGLIESSASRNSLEYRNVDEDLEGRSRGQEELGK